MFSKTKFVHVHTTFYGALIGEVRFGGTFRVSDLQGVGLWSDFEILAVNLKKVHQKMRNNAYKQDLKSETRYLFALSIKKPFKVEQI